MAFNFPNDPAVGEIHVEGGASAAGGAAYIWDGVKWKAIGQDVLQRSANLADVPDPSAALENLGGLPNTNPVVQGSLTATGEVHVAGEVTGGILRTTHGPGGVGSAGLTPGDGTHTGFLALWEGANDTVRAGYIGYADKSSKVISLQAEGGYQWRFDGSAYVYNGATVWSNDGNSYGTAWGGWLSNYLTSNYYVQGNAWSNNKVLIGWNGAGYLNAQVDASYLGRLVTDGNFFNFFSIRMVSETRYGPVAQGNTMTVPAGCVQSGFGMALGAGAVGGVGQFSVYYKYLQWVWNGTAVNAG